MSILVEVPTSWVDSIGRLHLPESADRRLQLLMDENTEGRLSAAEREELASLAEWSEEVSLLRAEAFHLLGQRLP